MIYLYYCGDCDLVIEYRCKLGQQPGEIECPECGKVSPRKYTVPITHYRGTGWSGTGHGVPDRDEREKQPGALDFSPEYEEMD